MLSEKPHFCFPAPSFPESICSRLSLLINFSFLVIHLVLILYWLYLVGSQPTSHLTILHTFPLVSDILISYFALSSEGLSDSSVGKESVCNAVDPGSIPGLGRSPGERKGYPLQYSCLENSMDCIIHRVTKSRHDWGHHFHFVSWTSFLIPPQLGERCLDASFIVLQRWPFGGKEREEGKINIVSQLPNTYQILCLMI